MSADPKLFQAFARTSSFSSGIPTSPYVGFYMASHLDKTAPTAESKVDDTSNLSKRRKLESTNLSMSPGFPRAFPRSTTEPAMFGGPIPFGSSFRPEGLGMLPASFNGVPVGVPVVGMPFYMMPSAGQSSTSFGSTGPPQAQTSSMQQPRVKEDPYSSDEDSISTMSVERSVTSRSVAEDEDSDADVDLPNLLLSLSSGILSGANAEVPTPNTNISFDHPPVSPDSDSMDSDNSYQRVPGSPSSMSDKPSSSKKRRLRCPHCNKTFSQGCSLKDHLNIHNSIKPYICPEPGCGKAFSNGSNLNRHRRIHTGEKPYICEICHKKFSQSSNLKVHIKIHQ